MLFLHAVSVTFAPTFNTWRTTMLLPSYWIFLEECIASLSAPKHISFLENIRNNSAKPLFSGSNPALATRISLIASYWAAVTASRVKPLFFVLLERTLEIDVSDDAVETSPDPFFFRDSSEQELANAVEDALGL